PEIGPYRLPDFHADTVAPRVARAALCRRSRRGEGLMLQPFVLEEPTSIGEASALLGRYGEAARLYAGGTELLQVMKEGLLHYERLINLKTIAGLDGITHEAGILRIGAAATHRALERAPEVRSHFPALAHLEAHVANVRVRATGTIGGNLCFAEPHADPAT